MRIAVFCAQGLDSFILPLVRHWESRSDYEVAYLEVTNNPIDTQKMFGAMAWASVVWCEWANHVAIAATHMKNRCPIVVRCHNYEAFDPGLKQGNWENVYTVVPIVNFVGKLFEQNIYPQKVNVQVINNGIETNLFVPPEDKQYIKSMVLCGYLNARKGVDFALMTLYELLCRDPEWTLTFIRSIQDMRYQWAMYKMVEDMGMGNNVFWKDFVPHAELPAVFNQHSVVLSTSWQEGSHCSLAEGMSAGLLGLCRNWEGAGETYPPESLCKTPGQMAQKVLNWWYSSEEDKKAECAWGRQWIVDRFTMEHLFEQVDELLERAAADGKEKREQALIELGLTPPIEKLIYNYDTFFELLNAPAGSTIVEWRDGAFLKEASKRGYNVMGAETSEIPGVMVMDESIPMSNIPYLFTSRLGDDLDKGIEWIKKSLAPDGKALLSLANAEFPGEAMLRDGPNEPMDTITRWAQLLIEAGFDIVQVKAWNGPFPNLPERQAYRFLVLVQLHKEEWEKTEAEQGIEYDDSPEYNEDTEGKYDDGLV